LSEVEVIVYVVIVEKNKHITSVSTILNVTTILTKQEIGKGNRERNTLNAAVQPD
jgi:hypothetical protein